MTNSKIACQLQVLGSVLKACKEIDWSTVYIPEGRSLKAVQEMIAGHRKHAPGPNGVTSAPSSAKTTPVKKAKKPAGEGAKRKRATKKSEDKVADEDDEENMGVKKQKTESEDEPEVKAEDEVGEAEPVQEKGGVAA